MQRSVTRGCGPRFRGMHQSVGYSHAIISGTNSEPNDCPILERIFYLHVSRHGFPCFLLHKDTLPTLSVQKSQVLYDKPD